MELDEQLVGTIYQFTRITKAKRLAADGKSPATPGTYHAIADIEQHERKSTAGWAPRGRQQSQGREKAKDRQPRRGAHAHKQAAESSRAV